MLKKILFTITFALTFFISVFIINKILPYNDIRFVLIGISCTIIIGFSQYLSEKWFANKE
ncbi:hypothetical protein LAV72_07310 [Lysinibacillus xylanilyticus]|jgi:uncharacterized membrane protein|uniref:hypothetical protein n=1 Tax=Lysinibacillus xylanilyticus TaxID=582475 RepID=UPI002B2418B3|nr:hypothetical protein [Lysinibacillus xylanilyticus]MEB2299430.1 hypothetical protein [Lysinibacillus xylanilyticus]